MTIEHGQFTVIGPDDEYDGYSSESPIKITAAKGNVDTLFTQQIVDAYEGRLLIVDEEVMLKLGNCSLSGCDVITFRVGDADKVSIAGENPYENYLGCYAQAIANIVAGKEPENGYANIDDVAAYNTVERIIRERSSNEAALKPTKPVLTVISGGLPFESSTVEAA